MEARLEEVKVGVNGQVAENYRVINEEVDNIETQVATVREEFSADMNNLKIEVAEISGRDVEVRLEQDHVKLKNLEEEI